MILVLKLIGMSILGIVMFDWVFIALRGFVFIIFIVIQLYFIFRKKHPVKSYIIPSLSLIIYIVAILVFSLTAYFQFDLCINNMYYSLMRDVESFCINHINGNFNILLQSGSLYGGLVVATIWYSSDKEKKKNENYYNNPKKF